MCRFLLASPASPAYRLGQIERPSIQVDLSGDHTFDVEQVIDQMGEVADLPHDHAARAGFGFSAAVRHLEHLDGAVDGADRIAQLVGQHRQELVLHAAVALGAVAGAVGLVELAEVGHDQIQTVDALRDR